MAFWTGHAPASGPGTLPPLGTGTTLGYLTAPAARYTACEVLGKPQVKAAVRYRQDQLERSPCIPAFLCTTSKTTNHR